MTIFAKVGSFVKDSTTGAHAQVVTGLGFQPKAIIFFSSMQTATGIVADANSMIGFSDGTTHKCVAASSNDAATTSLSSNSLNSLNCIVILQNGSTTIDSAGDINTFDTDGFTVGWNSASATQFIIGYIAVGGTDITNVKVMKHDSLGGAGSYTGVGFQPDIVFFGYGARAAAEANNATANSGIGFGASVGPSKSACSQAVVENGRTTSDTWRKQTIVSPMSMIAPANGGNANDWASLTSLDADGFSLGAPSSSDNTIDFYTLSIKGGVWDVGNFSQKSGTGTQNTSILAGLDPSLLILTSTNDTVNQLSGNGSSAGVAHCRFSFGASDGTNERCIWIGDTDNRVLAGNPTISKSSYSDTSTIQLITEPSTVNAAADFSAHTSGQFTLNWTTADATARLLWYVALAGAAGTTPLSQTSIQKYNIAKNVAQTNIHKYNIAKYLTQTSIQKYNIRVFVAILTSIQKYNLRRYLTQTNIQKYNLFKQILQTSIQKYNLRKFLAQTNIQKYNILKYLTQTNIHKHNIRSYVAISATIHKYNLLKYVLQPTIQKYNLRRYLSQTNIQKYATRQYVKAGKARLVIHIPLYIYPFHWIPGNEWQQVSDLIAANPDIDFIIKINPNSGPDTALNTDFIAGLNILTAGSNPSHMKIIGYVYTSYGDRLIADVKTDIDRYVSFYGSYLRGIFLDEMEDDPGEESYYQEITTYCHDRNFLSWGNPGKNISESYVSSNALDIFQISETDGYPTGTTIGNSTFNGTYPTSRFAIGIYNAATYNTALIEDFATKVQYIFVTSDVGPNPYDTVSEYIDDLVLHSRALLGTKQKYNLRQFVAATLSIHKYNIIQILTVIQASIQKYNVRKYLAQTSIHKYSLRAYLAQASIQKYNLRKFLAQTNIQKYNLLKYVTQPTIQKYNISKSILQASIQKYAIRKAVIQASIQKYNTIKQILQSSIQKYSIRKQILQASIQKYNVLKTITQASIQKYNLRVFVAITASIQKYNLSKNILAASIHKYSLRQYLAQTSIHKYNLRIFVAIINSIQKYSLRQYLAQTSIHKYTLRIFTGTTTSIHKYNLFKQILQASIHKYNLRKNIIAASIHKYSIIQVGNLVVALIAKYNVRQYVASPSVQKYTIRNFTPITVSIQKYNLLKAILQNSIQKYNTRQLILAASIHKYNLSRYITQITIHKYNTVQRILAASIHKYSLRQFLVQSSIQKYNLRIFTSITASIQKYNLRQYLAQINVHKYNVRQFILSSSKQKYNILVENMVVAALVAKYNIRQYVVVPTVHKYNFLNTIILASIQKYNLRQNVLQSSIHKYNTIARILSASIQKYNLRQNIVNATINKYNIRQLITQTSIHTYNIFAVFIVLAQSIQSYNISQYVKTKTIHKYNMGTLRRHLVSMFNAPGKLIEITKGSKLLQDFLHGEWPI